MWELYTGQELYDIDGKPFTENDMHKTFPASMAEQVVVRVAGNTLVEIKTLLQICAEYSLDYRAENVIELINYKAHLEQTKSDPLERIAASLEYLVLLQMEDKKS